MLVTFTILVLLFLFIMTITFRNSAVASYRHSLIDSIYFLSTKENEIDIQKANKNYLRRMHQYKKVTYDQMIWKFWKRIDSFYNLDDILS